MEIESMEIADKGAGSLTYFVSAGTEKYVVKYASDNEINHPELEPRLCEYLRKHGISACEFVTNQQGNLLSEDENGRRFHIQKYIEGATYAYNEAPDFLLEKALELLAEIHTVLKDFEELPEGIGENFFRYRRPEQMEQAFRSSLQTAIAKGDEDNAKDIRDILEMLERFPEYHFEVSQFTCGNTHGDYMISQIICGADSINGIIDWTTACRHPFVWEIMRSYIMMAPECKGGDINIEGLERYIEKYLEKGKLNAYDIENAGNLFFYFLAVCDFFGQYYQSMTRNRSIYLEQARLSAKMLRWFDKHIDELNIHLKKLAETM